MSIKIDKKIVGYNVRTAEEKQAVQQALDKAAEEEKKNNIIQMHENIARPEMLVGSTYKVKQPNSEHAMYITINDIYLNAGTEYEQRRPFEIFINSKNMEQFQWILALTRITSAVFRKGGDVAFLVEEMQAVFDPRGGYWKKGRYVPSLIAEIGDVINDHLIKIGMILPEGLSDHQQQILDEKRAQFEASGKARQSDATSTIGAVATKATVNAAVHATGNVVESADAEDGEYPAGAMLCVKCNIKASILMDGCMTCLSCGDSKCG